MTFEIVTKELLHGFWQNCEVFALTLLMAIPLGLVVTFGSMSKFKPLSLLKILLANLP